METPPFQGVIGDDWRDSSPWWPGMTRPPGRCSQRFTGGAGRRRLRPARRFRLGHRHPQPSMPWPPGACATELPHDGAVLSDPLVRADRAQPPRQRDGPGHRNRQRLPRVQRPGPPAPTASSPRCCWTPGMPPTPSASGTSPPRTRPRRRPRARWPLGPGFERFYGFMSGETHQFVPNLIEDNRLIRPPGRPEDGYHLTTDLVDQAVGCVRDLRVDRSRQAVLLVLLHRGRATPPTSRRPSGASATGAPSTGAGTAGGRRRWPGRSP